MKSAVIVFPGSNCDRDMMVALRDVSGIEPVMVWHRDTELPDDIDLIAIPGGFSYGDYLRSGAMAARAPVMRAVKDAAEKGISVLGICNGFQILTEVGLLPGALMRNAGINYICRDVTLKVENSQSIFTSRYETGEEIVIPVAHQDGNYTADAQTLERLEGEGRIAFRYQGNVNGSVHDIAGIINEAGNVLGMMPHPDRMMEPAHGRTDGRRLFEGLAQALG
jgi:phosphoribosylformylglycinamidine synthase